MSRLLKLLVRIPALSLKLLYQRLHQTPSTMRRHQLLMLTRLPHWRKLGAKIERNSEGDEPASKEDAQAKAALKAGDTFTPTDLVVRLSDDFEKDYPAPHHFDMTRWTKWKGDARTRNGQSILTPTPPGSLGFAGIGTRKKDFNRGLAGTNGVEVTLAGYASGEGGSEELDKPEEMRLDLAWALTLGSWHGQIGGQPDKQKDRGVQLHLDLIRPNGLYVYLVRGLLPEDNEKYPKDGYSPGGPPGTPERHTRRR